MRLFTYSVSETVRTPVGGKLSLSRRGIVASVGIRGRRGICLVLPLESESHWLRRREREHQALVARMLPSR